MKIPDILSHIQKWVPDSKQKHPKGWQEDADQQKSTAEERHHRCL
jgi:hypothetical protein